MALIEAIRDIITSHEEIRDIIVAGAAIATAIAATKGLSTWKKELRTRHVFDRATTLLERILELRDTIEIVRNPAMFNDEISAALHEAGIEPGNQQQANKAAPSPERVARLCRRNKVVEAWNAVRSARIPVIAACGNDAVSTLPQLGTVVGELVLAFDLFDSFAREDLQDLAVKEEKAAIRRKVYRLHQDDAFGGTIESALDAVEDEIRELFKFDTPD